MAGRAIDEATLDRAAELLRDPNASYASVSRETGISTDTLARRFPRDRRPGGRPAPEPAAPLFDEGPSSRPADPRPGSRRRASSSRGKRRRDAGPTDDQLEDLIRKLAMSPALLTKTVVRCDYCTTHFITTAPEVAVELMELAQDEPDLREALEWIWREWRKLAWASALGSWIGVPLAHHLMPERWYSVMVLLAGMPPRSESSHDEHRGHRRPDQQHTHPPAPAPAPVAGQPVDVDQQETDEAFGPAGLDLGSMSVSDLLAQAQGMGINLEAFGISQDDVAGLLRADGHTVVEVDVTDPETEHPARDNDDDQGHGDAGTPPDFIETDPTALSELGLDALEDIEPDPTLAPQADEVAAASANTNPEFGSA